MLSLWLIGKARSGAAVAISMFEITGTEFLLIVFSVLAACGIAAIATLKIAKRFVSMIEKIDYSKISIAVMLFMALLAVIFTGLYGALLLATCTALGMFASIAGIRRGVMMGVLMLPVILFYM